MPAKKMITKKKPVVDIVVDNVAPPPDKKPTKKPVKKSPRPAKKPVDEIAFREPIETSSKKIMCLLPDLISLSQHIITLGFRADEDEVLNNVNSMLRDIYLDEKKKLNAKNKGLAK